MAKLKLKKALGIEEVVEAKNLKNGDVVKKGKFVQPEISRYGYDNTQYYHTAFEDGNIKIIDVYPYYDGRLVSVSFSNLSGDLFKNIDGSQIFIRADPEKAKTLIKDIYESRQKNLKLFFRGREQYMSGTDPEVFVKDSNGKVIPAWEFLPSKEKAGRIPFWDGVQAEFNTAPTGCIEEQTAKVWYGLKTIQKLADEKFKGAKIHLADVVPVSMEDLGAWKEDHVALGCSKSINAYPDNQPINVPDPRILDVRFAGGHMHFGTGHQHNMDELVINLDRTLGVATVAMFEGFENPIRRKFYGMAGEYRLPEHGLEYRVPSNIWLCHPAIMQLTWDFGRMALALGVRGYGKFWITDDDETREAINDLNVNLARKILKRNSDIVDILLKNCYGTKTAAVSYAKIVFQKGIREVLSDPLDIENNWQLSRPTHPTYQTMWWSHLASKVNAAQTRKKAAETEQGQNGIEGN